MTDTKFTISHFTTFLRRSVAMSIILASVFILHAEGSLDVNKNPGKRLFLYAYDLGFAQQFKVYAKAGESINVGASHVGLQGGFIKVYSPKGTLVATFDDAMGDGIIHNNIEEAAGPNGGGTTKGAGYKPGIVPVTEEGVYSVHFSYPDFDPNKDWKPFNNLNVGQAWTRDNDQPSTFRRVVLAWDVTVSKNGAGNETGATLLKGRVFSNDLNLIINNNGNTASPSLYVLSREGFIYKLDFLDVDPWGFPITSNNVGLVNSKGQPIYKSLSKNNYKRTANLSEFVTGSEYLYEPQARDTMGFVNNKIFLNTPADDLPSTAMVTDIFRKDTHITWLLNEPPNGIAQLSKFDLESTNPNCGKGIIELDKGGNFIFTSNVAGSGSLYLDLNNNGSFSDPEDVVINTLVNKGTNKIFWNGKNGQGQTISTNKAFSFNYKFLIRSGEIHIMLNDVENNPGGTRITRMNGVDAPSTTIYYDNSAIPNGTVSGGGTPGNAAPTNDLLKYSKEFGNDNMLDYWTFVNFDSKILEKITVEINANCSEKPIDTDKDGIADEVDLDDDNDGVSDVQEFCNLGKGFTCLPGGTDPGADDDFDRIPNYRDAINNKTGAKQDCIDGNNDGICDALSAAYDTDGDNIPDHLDLDSDNDGITDLDEAGHKQPDVDRNGVIDGLPAVFGINGLYDPLDKDPTSLTAGSKYTPWDTDGDGVPDHDDLDSDNDGIHDVKEAGYDYELADADNDGRIDVSTSKPVDANGLPQLATKPIGYPKDFDGDGIPDWHDLDSDNDGINDVEEANAPDADNDGIIGTGKPVVNSNGVATADNSGNPLSTTSKPVDTDKDGIPDWHDLDSDNDGIKDVIEGGATDPDNDGIVGTGKPQVNAYGQPKDYSTSNPPDFDKDGIEDFRDTNCNIALDKPQITSEGAVCPTQEIVLFAQSNYTTNQYIWINALGDTLSTTGNILRIKENDPTAIAPFSVMVRYAGCKSNFSDPINVTLKQLPIGTSLKAQDDMYRASKNGNVLGLVTTNDNLPTTVRTMIVVVTNPKNGTVTMNNDGAFTYTPNKDFVGNDEFTYAVQWDECANVNAVAKVTIQVLDTKVVACDIPNVITPNGDGDNDVLFIPCADSYPNSELTVYNRWGSIVFNKRNYSNDWRGTYNGDLVPAGTYFYTYKLKPEDTDCQVGYVTVIRD